MRIQTATAETLEDWLELRQALWSWGLAEHRTEALAALANPGAVTFLARDGLWPSASPRRRPPLGSLNSGHTLL